MSMSSMRMYDTSQLLDVGEGDLITFNDRGKPVRVTDVSETEDGRICVECEGTWENAARYRLYRSTDPSDESLSRVERPQISSDGTKKFLKDGDLGTVTITERGDDE